MVQDQTIRSCTANKQRLVHVPSQRVKSIGKSPGFAGGDCQGPPQCEDSSHERIAMRLRHRPQNLMMALLSLAVWWEKAVGAVALRGGFPRVDRSNVLFVWFAFTPPGNQTHEP